MEYCISQEVFNDTFVDKSGRYSHKTNIKYNLFPFTGSTSDKPLGSFDNILGAFIRTVFSVNAPKEINRDEIIEQICSKMSFGDNPANRTAFVELVKDLYFADDNNLKCTSINTYKYTSSTKNDQKISEYIVSALCDVDMISNTLSVVSSSSNILDGLVESSLPELSPKSDNKKYISFIPQLRECFNNDLAFLIKDKNVEFYDLIQIISFYYFTYTSQVILNLNRFCQCEYSIVPIYYCMSWEKSSKTRKCYNQGWNQIDRYLDTMFSHAVLLEMLNQNESAKKYCYKEIFDEYSRASADEQDEIFKGIETIKKKYITEFAPPEGFQYETNNYTIGDIESLIHGFFKDIMLQFRESSRKRANEAYKSSFYEFSRNNFLQNRKAGGLLLVLNEELLVLLTKVVIGNKKQMKVNELFSRFQDRGIYLDKNSQDSVIEFYEKLNLIEKKSDSGDAQYVKGIL